MRVYFQLCMSKRRYFQWFSSSSVTTTLIASHRFYSRHSIFDSPPSASSVAYNPSGEILICREGEDLLSNKPEENKTVPKQLTRIANPARRLNSAKFGVFRCTSK